MDWATLFGSAGTDLAVLRATMWATWATALTSAIASLATLATAIVALLIASKARRQQIADREAAAQARVYVWIEAMQRIIFELLRAAKLRDPEFDAANTNTIEKTAASIGSAAPADFVTQIFGEVHPTLHAVADDIAVFPAQFGIVVAKLVTRLESCAWALRARRIGDDARTWYVEQALWQLCYTQRVLAGIELPSELKDEQRYLKARIRFDFAQAIASAGDAEKPGD